MEDEVMLYSSCASKCYYLASPGSSVLIKSSTLEDLIASFSSFTPAVILGRYRFLALKENDFFVTQIFLLNKISDNSFTLALCSFSQWNLPIFASEIEVKCLLKIKKK